MDENMVSKKGEGNPQNGALTPKKWVKMWNTSFDLKIGMATNLSMEDPNLNSDLENTVSCDEQ